MSTLRILLHAGASFRLTRTTWGRVFRIAASLAGSAEMVQMMFNTGVVNIGKISEHRLLRAVTVACELGNLGFIRVLAHNGVNMDDGSIYAKYELFPPIITAKSFRQDALVQMLLEINVRDIDPLTTSLGELFARGEYPRDPKPPRQCRMPRYVF
jgi:hypothetical protein